MGVGVNSVSGEKLHDFQIRTSMIKACIFPKSSDNKGIGFLWLTF